MTRTLPLLWALACTSTGGTDSEVQDSATPTATGGTTVTATGSGSTTTTDNWVCRDDVDPSELNGVFPPTELAPTEFTAFNRDGSERGPTDLMPRPTVMWFYPKAGTAG